MVLELFVVRSKIIMRFEKMVEDVKRIFGPNLLCTDRQPNQTLKKFNNSLSSNLLVRSQHFGQHFLQQNGGHTAVGGKVEVVLSIIFHRNLIIDYNFKWLL